LLLLTCHWRLKQGLGRVQNPGSAWLGFMPLPPAFEGLLRGLLKAAGLLEFLPMVSVSPLGRRGDPGAWMAASPQWTGDCWPGVGLRRRTCRSEAGSGGA